MLAIGDDLALVSVLWHREIANVLLTLESKQRVRDALVAYANVVRLPIDRAGSASLASLYDAAYLALSKTTSHPLATLDVALARAALVEGALFEA